MIHCFYHSADLDGHCSGAIVKYRFPDAVMHPINYGYPFPWEEIKPEDEVYMVDFCLQPFSEMVRLYDSGAIVIWIDHHKSAIDSYNKWYHNPSTDALDYMKFEGERDTSQAACELTWKYLFLDRPIPLAVKLLSLYDSWTYQGHELEDMVLPFQTRMRMEDLDPKDYRNAICWRGLFENDFLPIFDCPSIDQLVEEGRLLLRYDEKMKADYARTYSFETTLKVPVLCSAPDFTDELIRCGDYEHKAIAINLGHTNSKVFDSVWRKECAVCRGIGSVNHCIDAYGTILEGICKGCNGTGYIEPYDIMISFCRRSDKLWNVSLYSTKPDIDCGAIAKSFGGGGHKGAAGFQCKEVPFEY